MGERIFLIASNTALIDQLTEILAGAGLSIAGTANDSDQARSSLQYIDTDMILLVTPMGRESGDRLAKDLYYIKPYCGMIIATAAEKFPLFEKRLDDALAFLIAKPINKAALLQAIQHLQKSLAILTASRQKYLQLEKKLDDLRVISRAKNILISNLHMTEQQAHSYIQKQSMDMRLSPREVAEGILNTYEI